jgi:hypothetical protein
MRPYADSGAAGGVHQALFSTPDADGQGPFNSVAPMWRPSAKKPVVAPVNVGAPELQEFQRPSR